MKPEQRAILEGMALQLEQIAAKGFPLSVADEVLSWRILLDASRILSEMDSSVMTDEVVNRLRAAVDHVGNLASDKEQFKWIN